MRQDTKTLLQVIEYGLIFAMVLSGIILLIAWFQRIETRHIENVEENRIETEAEAETEEEIEIVFVPIEIIETEAETEIETEVEVIGAEPVITYEYIKDNYYFWSDAMLIAMIMTNECASVPSDTEQACVAWTILNRVDREGGIDVFSIVTAPHQFAWDENTVPSEHSYALAEDVLIRWVYEKLTREPLGRVLPNDYYYFYGNGSHNFFYQDYEQPDIVWDYSLTTPYDS